MVRISQKTPGKVKPIMKKKTAVTRALQSYQDQLEGPVLSSTPVSQQHVPLFTSTITPMRKLRKPSLIASTNADKSGSPSEVPSDQLMTSTKRVSSNVKNYTKRLSKAVSKHSKNETSEPGQKRKKKRYRPGTRALMEIRHYQKRADLLIPRAPFARLIKEVFQDIGASNYKVQRIALEALQEAAEAYLVFVLEMANLCSIHAKRVTLYPADIRLVKKIRGV